MAYLPQPQTGPGYLSSFLPFLSHSNAPGQAYMGNPDPTNEFMYQVPMQVPMLNSGSGMGTNGSQAADRNERERNQSKLETRSQSQSVDPAALARRLKGLGLQKPSDTDLPATNQDLIPEEHLSPGWSPRSHPALASAFRSPEQHQYRSKNIELRPQDSISMYRPSGLPTDSMRSQRRGGTNVDPGEGDDYAAGEFAPEDEQDYDGGDAQSIDSYRTHEQMTMGSPNGRTLDELERMTREPNSAWTHGTVAGDMYTMRERLLNTQARQGNTHDEELARQFEETSRLAATLTKLESAEKQLRHLQATLIAEQVARTQIEQDRETRADDLKDCKNELAGAVRALRRARDEGTRGDEERRRLARAFDETKTQLFRYHEELRVRDARARGREEGRQEDWQEAERWMGGSPPIPVEPVQSLPNAVLHQTPRMQPSQPQQYQSPQQDKQPPPMPSASPMAFQQNNYQPPPDQPQQSEIYHQLHNQGLLTGPQGPLSHRNPSMVPQTQHNGQQQPSQQRVPSEMMPIEDQMPPSQYAPQYQQPPQQMSRMAQQIPHQMQSFQLPQPAMEPTALTVPHMVGDEAMRSMMFQGQPPGMLQQGGMVPPPRTGPPGSRSVPQYSTPLPVQRPSKAATVAHQTPRGQPSVMQTPQHPQATTQQAVSGQPSVEHETPRRGQSIMQPPRRHPSTQMSRPGPAPVQVPQPESIRRPHPADTYLDRVDHDAELKRMLSGAPSKTIHTMDYPPSEPVQRRGKPVRDEENASTVEKPLPPVQSHISRSQTMRPSRSATLTDGRASKNGQRRTSLTDGLHAHSHAPNHVADGDRYPAFPGVGGKDQSRQTSYGSVDPANYALPSSHAPSVTQTPHLATRRVTPQQSHNAKTPQQPQYGRTPEQSHQNMNETPRQSASIRARSKMAGALRNDHEIASTDLSEIEEEVQPRAPQEQTSLSQSRIMQNILQPQRQHSMRKAPSLPPMRRGPIPIMPGFLSGGKTKSEIFHPSANRPTPQQLMAMYGGAQATAAARNAPEPRDDNPVNCHPLYVPPGMAHMAVGASIEDIQGPRHSALGLEGLESRTDTMKAPTISVQPPCSNQLSANPTHHYTRSKTPFSPTNIPGPPQAIPLPMPTHRKTIVVTETYSPQPHDVPIPTSHSKAPTAYTAFSPEAIPIPAQTGRHSSFDPFDLAVLHPLPDSRATTVFGDPRTPKTAMTVTMESETDIQDPDYAHRSKQTGKHKSIRRKPVPEPTPTSKDGNHRAPKASTYARTEGTIDEVTEEESGRENRMRRR